MRRRMAYLGVATIGLMLVVGLSSGCRENSASSADTGLAVPTTQPVTTTQAAWPPDPPAGYEHTYLRRLMVEQQIAHPRDGRQPVRDERVLDAMRVVPRHAFVPGFSPRSAYADTPLPVGYEQTISQPYIVALMSELLKVTEESKVLEIGTGSGYQAAVLYHLTPHVYTVEIVEPLARHAAHILAEQGYEGVACRAGDGFQGWPEEAPFDAMILTCSAPRIPEPLWAQLKPGGRIVLPKGPAGGIQRLVVITKTADGRQKKIGSIPVRFVPMTGQIASQPAGSSSP